jgi:sugar phosphate isomerase/epimerase
MRNPIISRRNLLLGAGASAILATNSVTAIDPIPRNGKAKFKFSLAAYSYRSLLKGEKDAPAKLSLTDFIADCAKLDLEGTELTSYYFPQPVTFDYLRALRKQAFQLGLDISGTAVGNDFGLADEVKRREEIQKLKTWVDFAEVLTAPVIRVFAGHQAKEHTRAESHRIMVQALEECCDYAGKKGIFLALENHGGPTETAEGLLEFVRDIRSPWFGVNLDTGNFESDEVYADLAKLAPYALNIQVKVKYSKKDKSRHDMNYENVAKLLRDAGYRGYVVLEYEEEGDVQEECKKHLTMLREAFGKV